MPGTSATTGRQATLEIAGLGRQGPELPLHSVGERSGLIPDGPSPAVSYDAPDVRAILASKQAWRGGRGYAPARWLGAGVFAAVVITVAVSIATGSAKAFAHFGPGFVWSGTYSPDITGSGAGVLIVGTVVTTAVALAMAAPIGLGAAISLAEFVPSKVSAIATTLVELLAAVPSIVVGLWALLVLSPLFRSHVEPFLHSLPVLGGAVFGGPDYGPSILLAAVVLSIMTLPTLVSLSRSALRAVPLADREAAMALGATRWQVVRKVVWPAARPGIAAAVTLAIGRALGEAIAVALVIGNEPSWPHSLVGPGATLGSSIVNQFSEAEPGLGASSVIALGAVLFVLTVVVNIGGQALRRAGRTSGAGSFAAPAPPPPPGQPADGTAQTIVLPGASLSGGQGGAPVLPDGGVGGPGLHTPAEPYAGPHHTLRRRRLLGTSAQTVCGVCLAAAAAPLVALVVYTVARGAPALSFGFLVHPVAPAFVPGGGISTAIAGSARVVGLALVMAAPPGLLTALFLFERPGRIPALLRFGADVLSGVPSIVIGIVAYEIVVRPMHGASTLAASIALAVLMLPIMVRADEEAIRTVSVDLQEAGAALGAPRWRVVRSVVLRGSMPGLVAGNLLALARAIGETAPLLFTLASANFAMTLLIFTDAQQPETSLQQVAWATALVLLGAVLALSAFARFIAWWLTRRAR
jgi:phosphate ABC transporter permease protein PstC/phosphate ABC transporter permease subunit PstA